MGSSSSVMFTVAMPLVPLATRSGRSNRGCPIGGSPAYRRSRRPRRGLLANAHTQSLR